MNSLTYSKNGLSLTESFESCAFSAYQDQRGVWTIGWGHTGAGAYSGATCTQEQADTWLQQDAQWAAGVVNKMVNIPLSQDEFDALVDFVFNCGSGKFISSTLLKDLNAGNLTAAADQFDQWDHSSGKVVAGLLRRRQAETNLFES